MQTIVLELSLDFDKCTDKKHCENLLVTGLMGANKNRGPVFGKEVTQSKEVCICKIPSDVNELIQRQKRTHKGNVIREIRKAEKKGFYCHFFNYFNYIPDIIAINRSQTIRRGKKMSRFYTADEVHFGPTPTYKYPLESPVCEFHSISYWGVFSPSPGRKIGSITVDETLVGYIRAFRINAVVWYNMIVGHGDYLKFNIMSKLHSDLIEYYIETNSPPKYIYYGAGLNVWKRKALFEEMYVQFDDLHEYYRIFKEGDRSLLKRQINQYISQGEFMLAEAIITLLRYHPERSLKARVKGHVKKFLDI